MDNEDPSYEAVSSNHSSFFYYMVEEDVPSYEEDNHANDASYDEGVCVGVCVDVCVDACVGEDVDEDVDGDVDGDEDVNIPSYEPDLMHDLPISACYDEEDAVVLEKVLVDLMVAAVVLLSDGKKVDDLMEVVVAVDTPSCETLVVVDKNDELVVDNVRNHIHNGVHDRLQYVLFSTRLTEHQNYRVVLSKTTMVKQAQISTYYLKVLENHALSSSVSNLNSLWNLLWYFHDLFRSLNF